MAEGDKPIWDQMQNYVEQMKNQKAEIEAKEQEIAQLKEQLESEKNQLNETKESLEREKSEFETQKAQILQKESEFENREREIATKQQDLLSKEEGIVSRESEVAKNETEVTELRQKLVEREEQRSRPREPCPSVAVEHQRSRTVRKGKNTVRRRPPRNGCMLGRKPVGNAGIERHERIPPRYVPLPPPSCEICGYGRPAHFARRAPDETAGGLASRA